MGIIMGADTATNTQPAASPRRYGQFKKALLKHLAFFILLSCTILFANGQQDLGKIVFSPTQIDSICKVIDSSKSLHSSSMEGENPNSGGWTTYMFHDKPLGGKLYMAHNENSTSCTLTNCSYCTYQTYIYYNDQKVIKTKYSIENYCGGGSKTFYSVVYYFNDNKLIKAVDEDLIYSSSVLLLSEATSLQSWFTKHSAQ